MLARRESGVICAKLERELIDLADSEAAEFRAELGLPRAASIAWCSSHSRRWG
jgi:hypothetical protein